MHMILVARHGQFIEIEKSNQQNWNTNKQQVLRHLHGNPSGSTLPGDLKDFDTTNPPKRILKATRTAIVVETFRKSKRAHAEALERDEEELLVYRKQMRSKIAMEQAKDAMGIATKDPETDIMLVMPARPEFSVLLPSDEAMDMVRRGLEYDADSCSAQEEMEGYC